MKHSVPITLVLVTFFFLSQLIGLTVINKYVNKELTAQTGQVVYEELPYGIERPEVEPKAAFLYLIVALLIGTVLFLLLVKFKKKFLWKLWFYLATLLCLSIAFAAFMSPAIAAILGVVLATLKIFRPTVLVHNFTELFIYGGLAILFVPLLNVVAAFLLLVILAIYDMFAVWKSKHMIKLARFQAKTKMFAGLFVPYKRVDLTKRAKTAKKAKIKTAVLGGGDMAFPLMFAGTVMSYVGFFKALIIPLCAAVVLFLLFLFAKKDHFYPAMPFLTAGCLVGYLIAVLL